MFTRNQIEEIKKKLVAFGTKDTQLLDAHKLDGNEIVAIVQDGENRKIPLSSIIGMLSDISVTPNDDFINVSKDTTVILTLDTAVSKVDINNRKLGQVITFKDSANSWAIRQFAGRSLDNWHDISLWKSISGIDELKSQVESNAEDISVLSDEIERHDASILNLSTDVSKLKDKDIEISSSLSGLTTRVDTLKSQADTNTASISENKIAIEKNTSDIKNVSDTVNAHTARLDDVDTTLENVIFKNKGYFTTVEKLNEAIPNPTIGSKAYVGTSEPYAIYIVENGAWVDSGETGGVEDFNLGEYMEAMKSVDFKQTSPNVIEYEETKFNVKETKSIPQATETFAGAMSAQHVKDLKSSVKVTEQSFTDTEKKQVCANIGVIKMDTTKTEDQVLTMIDNGEIDSETLYIITQ